MKRLFLLASMLAVAALGGCAERHYGDGDRFYDDYGDGHHANRFTLATPSGNEKPATFR